MSTDFGRDVSCGPNGLRTGRLSTGVVLLVEAAFRRLTTPRGTLRGGAEEEIYGEDITALVGRLEQRGASVALPGIVRAELLKDERFNDVTASLVRTVTPAGAVTYTISVSADTDAGPFTLKLAASEVSAELLGYTVP